MAVNTEKTGRTMPNNIEAEQSLLGCILVDSEVGRDILSVVIEDDFYVQAHKVIISAMKAIPVTKSVELVTLSDYLERNGLMPSIGGMTYLVTLNGLVPSSANYKIYLDIVKRASKMRRLIHSCTEIIGDAYTADDGDETLALAEKRIYDISENEINSDLLPLSIGVSEVLDKINRMRTHPTEFRGVPTGFARFDSKTGGFQKGALIILAALTGHGKTSMAMNIVEHSAKQGMHIAFFSLEMPQAEIAQRLLSSLSGIGMTTISNPSKLTQEKDMTNLLEAQDIIAKTGIYVNDSSSTTPEGILSQCRRLKSRYGLDLIVVDYLQLMSLSDKKKVESRQLEIAEITRSLKIIAKELKVPILALSQLSREAAKRNDKEGKEPVLSDLRESGAIEQDADMVLFIHKKIEAIEGDVPEDAVIDVDLIIAKNRSGPTDKIPLKWIGNLVRFCDPDKIFIKPIDNKTNKKVEPEYVDAPLPEEAPPTVNEQGQPT